MEGALLVLSVTLALSVKFEPSSLIEPFSFDWVFFRRFTTRFFRWRAPWPF
jgi:hypothetical protein